MAYSQADKQRVYLASRAIFTGQKALLRRQKKVREEISRRPQVLGSLTRDLGIEKVVEILRGLLEQRIFESELRAKVEFPELFRSSLEQEIQREASEIDAAKSTAEALEEIASEEGAEADADEEEVECTLKQDEVDEGTPNKKNETKTLPSLYPIQVPYNVQHLILNEAQRMLEESCFQFTQKWLPSVLEKKGWNCASSVELTKWTRVLANEASHTPKEAYNLGGKQLDEVLFATNTLRHSAVHRLPTTARGITELIKSAVAMASALGDVKHAAQLEEICDELGSKVKSMELYKNALENTAIESLHDIQRQREQLDRQEREVVQRMVNDDAENKTFVGLLLEDSIGRILHENSEDHETLKYHLLGPSLTKAGQESVDQSKVSEIIYNASKGSKYFNREEEKDKVLTQKIDQTLEKKRRLEKLDLTRELRAADQLMAQLELSRDLTQHIVHIDCDAFYAAVEQLDRPEIEHVPFAVGSGVLTTCNYVARKFGVRSGMAGFVAKKLCPELLLLRPNFDKYSAKAQEVREILADYDPRFESASIDEAYLNVTQYCIEHDMTPEDAVQQMRQEIHQKTKVTVSAGIAANTRLAKICSNMNKPNGQYTLPNERNAIMNFMRDLSTRKVNGIGRVLERELQEIGIRTCGDIYPNRQFLRQLFGDKTYEFLIVCHLGLGRTEVQPAEEYERKSVGTESTFRDISDFTLLKEKLRWTAEELEKDMRRAECKGRTLVLKVKLHTYEVFTRQVATPKAICQADDLYNYSLPILTRLQQEIPSMKLRLMGLRCTNLISTKKPDARAFFGLKPLGFKSAVGPAGVSRKRSVGHVLDEVEGLDIDNAAEPLDVPQVNSETPEPGNCASAKDGDYRHHGKEIVPNPTKQLQPAEQEEWWDCPICSRPQPMDERLFNDHIDLCLSRQTIRDTVQEDSKQGPAIVSDLPASKRLKGSGDKKRGRPPNSDDPRQMKLFFG
ncbi:hypothetical protein F5X99DRAFT_419415 [Biscogniauxia marginata]|nr:hypothetical protein F5X99DRAFT_419415 [Biscogniauxia marginata]